MHRAENQGLNVLLLLAPGITLGYRVAQASGPRIT
ncbi:MAG: hypothetical protein JWO29_1975 [Arthrobacter sp.]|nr:hypothetical protein [Arthrobacter sp.]